MNAHRRLLTSLLIGVLAAGCGDTSRAAAPPPPAVKVEPVVEKDVPIYRRVGRNAGRLHQRADPRPRQRPPVSQNYKEGSLVKSRRPPVPGRSPAVPDRRSTRPRPRLRLAESQLSQAKAQVTASQAQVEQALAKVAQDEAAGQARRGHPAPDRARRRPLHAAGAARIGEPAGARQRGAEQPREPGRRRRRARRRAERAGQRGAGGGRAREVAAPT